MVLIMWYFECIFVYIVINIVLLQFGWDASSILGVVGIRSKNQDIKGE